MRWRSINQQIVLRLRGKGIVASVYFFDFAYFDAASGDESKVSKHDSMIYLGGELKRREI